MPFCIILALNTVSQELDHVALLCRVTEVVGNGWLQYLRYQVAHITKTGDHFWSLISWYVNDLRHVKIECKTVGRTNGNGTKVLIQFMCFGTTIGPVQYNISCRNYFHRMSINVHRVLTWVERFVPYAFL